MPIICEKCPKDTLPIGKPCPKHGTAHLLHDLSTIGNKNTVLRIVRPRNHIGTAYGGDRVKLDADELKAPAIAAAVWTDAEARTAAEELDRRRAAMWRDEPSGAMRAADAALAASMERRQREAEEARTTMPT